MLGPFRVLDPPTVEDAVGELRGLGEAAKVYAGGAELLLLLRHKLVQADALLNIKPIMELNELVFDGTVFHIGACVTHRRLERDPLVRHYLPMFARAESQVANVRVRAQGTIGGNLCFSDPHSDPGTALLVHGARVKIRGSEGTREMPLSEFLVGMYATALKPDELLVQIEVPPLPSGWGCAYLRVHRLQRPTLGVAAAARLQQGKLDGVRLAVGCVGAKPERLSELEGKMLGIAADDALRLIDEQEPYLAELLRPVDDILGSREYKLYLSRVLVRRALSEAVERRDEGERMDNNRGRAATGERPRGPARARDGAHERREISLTINGRTWRGEVPAEQTLLEFLRRCLGLTGTKRSCESQVCGACTVLVDNLPVSACNYLAFEAHERAVLTIEGLAAEEAMDPLQQAFIRNVGGQCGYCTPGQIMAAKALLLENPAPTREEIGAWLRGNVCRCGAYPAIVTSILEAAREDAQKGASRP